METADDPLVSVVVPFFNAAGTIGPCLEALSRQDAGRFEVIAVNDGSTDTGPAIAAGICAAAGFTLISLPFNKGQAVARNEGASRASGSLLAFVDADVIVPPDWISRWKSVMCAAGAPDAACCGYTISSGEPPAALFASHEAFFRRLNLRSKRLSSITAANCIIRRQAFDSVGGFPEYYIEPRGDTLARKAVASNEDSELGFLMHRGGFDIRWVDSNPVRHVFRPDWKGYLRQQRYFAWAGAVSVFRFPGILLVDDLYSGERVIPQLAVALLLLVSPLVVLAGWPGVLAGMIVVPSCLLFFAVYHRRFFSWLGKEGMEGYGRLRVYLWMLAARFVWLYGVCNGIADGFAMRIRGYGSARRRRK